MPSLLSCQSSVSSLSYSFVFVVVVVAFITVVSFKFVPIHCQIHPLVVCVAIMVRPTTEQRLNKAAVAAGNAIESSGDSASQLVVKAEDAPSTPRKEAAVAAENATGSSGAPASRKDAPSTAVAHVPQALTTKPISDDVFNAAVAAYHQRLADAFRPHVAARLEVGLRVGLHLEIHAER